MKIKPVLLILLLMVPVAASQVTYDIQSSSENATISTDVTLDCNRFNCPLLTWNKPSGFQLVNITDSEGKITSYEETQSQVEIDTGSPNNGDSKTITINFRTEQDAEEIYSGLYTRTFSLSGFSDQTLQGKVQSDNLISGDIGYGFESSYGGEYFNFTGQGPINIDVNFGDGKQTEHYVFFGEVPSGLDTSEAYEISVGTTGQVQNYGKIPVAVIPGETYNRTQTSWSSGEYSSGSIRMRSNLDKEQFNPTLARETVHALNDQLLDWDQTRSSYIDEGSSEFVGYLVERRQIPVDQRQESVQQLFGETVTYDPDPNDRTYFRIPSNGQKEKLWNYYQQDADFMKTWTPGDSQYRSFGYAYSELIIRHNLVEKDMKLSELYRYFEHSEEVEDPQKKWQVLSENLDLTPCKTDNRTRFNNCLDRVNNHSNFQAYTAEPERDGEKLVINETKTPDYNQTEDDSSFLGGMDDVKKINGRETFGHFVKNLIQYISQALSSLLS